MAALEAIRQETGAPIRSDGTINAGEVAERLYQTRDVESWIDRFSSHKVVQATFTPEDLSRFTTGLRASREIYQASIDAGFLPVELDVSPLRSNADFIKSFDITTICPRQDQFTATINAVERKLGKLLEPAKRHLVGLMLRDAGAQPACWYCYGQAGRDSFDSVVKKALGVARQVVAKPADIESIFRPEDGSIKWTPTGGLGTFLKANAKQLGEEGLPGEVRLRDLVLSGAKAATPLEQGFVDAVRLHAQGATHANEAKGWGTLKDQILEMPKSTLELLRSRAGLRMNSQTDFRPWHVIEVSEAIASMRAVGLPAHVYTKETNFLRIFGKTGIKFNLSAFYARNTDGSLQRDAAGRPVFDDVIGMSGPEIERWVKELPRDAGGMLVAHNDEALLAGLEDDRVFQVIPYHAGPLAQTKAIGVAEHSRDYTSFQHEHGWQTRKVDNGTKMWGTEVNVAGKWVKKGTPVAVAVKGRTVEVFAGESLDASHHLNDQDFYLALTKRLGLTPKFADLILDVDGKSVSVLEHPGYMKLIRDVAREPNSQVVPDPTAIDWDAAYEVEAKWVAEGGDQTEAEPSLVANVLDRIRRGDWPEVTRAPTQEEASSARARVASKQAEKVAAGAQRVFQEGEPESPKGYTDISKSTSAAVKVFFNSDADVSTVVHELGHAFLELLRGLASRTDAPQRTRDTWAAAQAFLGNDGGTITREQHETWARSFEAYLMEGKAPSGALAKAFAKAKLWMMDIYRAIRGVPGAKLNEDARRIFDALLATEDELNAQVRRHGPEAPRPAGITDAQWRERLEAQREAYDDGNRRVQLQAIKDALRVHESWWRAGVAKLEEIFAEEFERLPGRVAQRLIDGTELGEPIILDRDAVQAVIGKARVHGLHTAAGGTRPGAIAAAAGFPSGETMLAALAGLRQKDAWVAEQAQAEMERLHPGILSDITRMKAEVADGLQAVTEKRILDEWAELRREDPTIGAAPIAVLQRTAEKLVEQRQAFRLRPAQALQLERRAARAKATAAAKGDWTGAAKAAREQLLNSFIYRELLGAEKEIEKLQALAQRMAASASRERLGKASPVYRDAVDFILGAAGLAAQSKGLDTSSIRQAVAQMNGDAVLVGDPDWLDPLLEAIASEEPWERWTMSSVRKLRDSLKSLSAAATQRSTVLLDNKRASKEEVKAAIIEEVSSNLRVRAPLVEAASRTIKEKLAVGLNQLDGFLLSPIDIVRDLIGDDQSSTTWKAIVLPLRRGEVQEADMLRTVLSPVFKSFESMPKSMRSAWADPIDGRALFPSHIEAFLPRWRYELIMMALNSGSETSLKALTEGRGITLDELHRALGVLTAEEISWVNGVHKQLESLREPAFALEERQTGLRPQAVEAVPIQLPNGKLTGGYFPLKAIKEGSVAGERQAADEVAALFDPSYTRPVTAHGHLKSRSGAAYPVVLDPDTIRKHLIQVVHDIAFREAVQSVAALVMDPEVKSALIRWAGPGKADQFVTWLKDIAGVNGINPSIVMRLASFLKGNMASALLSGPSTAIGNLANLPTAVASTALKAKHLAAAVFEVGRSPRATRAEALERSGILRQMADNLAQDFERSLGGVRKGLVAKAADVAKDAGLWLMRSVDLGVSTAVWTGAYRQALAADMAPAAAARWADDILLQVQPSSSVVEKAGILRDRSIGIFVLFYGYLSVAYRAQHRVAAPLLTREFQESSAAGKAGVTIKTAGSLFGFWVAYQVLGELLMGRGPEEGDQDDEEPDSELLKWRNWFLRKTLVAPLAVLPLVPAASSVEGVILKKPVSPRQDPVSNLISQLVMKTGGAASKYMHDEVEFSKVAVEALRSAGLLTGLPTRLFETTGVGVINTITGDGEPVAGPGDAVSRLIYGTRKTPADNLITSTAEAFGLDVRP